MILDLKRFFKLCFLFAVLFLFSACGGGSDSGQRFVETEVDVFLIEDLEELEYNWYHGVKSPYEDYLLLKGGKFPTGKTSNAYLTTGELSYDEFLDNYEGYTGDSATNDGGEMSMNPTPYCKIGGNYDYTLHSYSRRGETYDYDETLFYCSTTKDLIESAKMPSSWNQNNLVLYCNDGNDINFGKVNLDFITSKMDVYKLCTLKNLDLKDNNTIIFGYEVGNRIIESESNFTFYDNLNFSNISYPVLIDLNYTVNSSNITEGGDRVEVIEYAYAPYSRTLIHIENR